MLSKWGRYTWKEKKKSEASVSAISMVALKFY